MELVTSFIDLVLHLEQVGHGLFEAFGPEVASAFGIDELNIDPKPVATALHRTFQHVTDVQFAADALHIYRLAFEGKGGVSRNHEQGRVANQAPTVGSEACGRPG